MKKTLFVSAFVVLYLTGCASELSQNDTLEKEHAQSEKYGKALTNLQTLASTNNIFAFDLYQKLAKKESNLFFSPLSISEVLGMTYFGTSGKTKQEMASVLHFRLSDKKLKYAFRDLEKHLKKFNSKEYTLRTANAIWPEKSFMIKKSFTKAVKTYFSSNSMAMDYINYAQTAKETINQWIARKTQNRIKNIISFIDPQTKLILTNAVYFKAKWQQQFDKRFTTLKPFTLLGGTKVDVSMMKQTSHLLYMEKNDYQAVLLPYKKNHTVMTVILPKRGKYHEIVKRMNATFLSDIHQHVNSNYEVDLHFPKFKLTTDVLHLIRHFKALGMQQVFREDADFSNLSEQKGLSISQILHKAFIEVSEKETEAAAATVVMVGVTSAMPLPPSLKKEMNVNRPYIIVIQDTSSKQIIFLGNILHPSK